MAEDATVQFGADISAIEESANRMRFVLEGLSNPLRGLRDTLGEVAEAFLAAFAVEKIAEVAQEMGELGEQTARTSAILGVSTEEVGKLQGIAVLTGTSTEGLNMAFERLQGRLGQANAQMGPVGSALAALNIQFNEFKGMSVDQQIELLADKFSKLADGPQKTAIAYNLLGRSGANLIPMLDQGRAGFEEMSAEIEKTGTVLDEVTTNQLKEMNDGIHLLYLSIKGDLIAAFTPFIGVVNGTVDVVKDLAQNFVEAMHQGGMLKDTVDLLAVAFKGLVTAIAAIIIGLEATWSAAIVIVDDLGNLFIQLGKAIWDALHFNFSQAVDDLKDIGAKATDTMKTYLDNIKTLNQQYKKQIDDIWGTGSSGGESNNSGKSAAPNMPDMSGNLSAAMKEIESEIKIAQEGLKQKTELYNLEANTFQITQDQKYGMLQTATQQEYELEKSLLENELALDGLRPQQRAAINAKIEELEAKHNTEMLKLDEQSIANSQKLYSEYFTQLQSSFNGQLRGLLAGTTTFSQAMKAVFGDMIIFVIEQIEKMAFNWLAGQLAMTTATTTGAAARAAAEQGSATASIAANLGKILSNIMSSVGQVFAGVSGFLAPILGPAAPAAAAPVAAGVEATAMSFIPLEVGTTYVPGTMNATLHQGEMVVPSTFSEGIRQMMMGGGGGSSGGGDVYHIQALDAASFEQVIMRNGAAFSRAVRKIAREGN